MSTGHPYSVSVDARHRDENGYRWTIAGSPSGKFSSRETYGTRREALVAGDNAVLRLARIWRQENASALEYLPIARSRPGLTAVRSVTMFKRQPLTSSISVERLGSLVRALSGGRRGASTGTALSVFARRRPPSSAVRKRPGIHEILSSL